MVYLLLCILFNTLLVFIFKLFQRYHVRTFHAIAINYVVCVVTGAFFEPSDFGAVVENLGEPWSWASFLLGSLFIGSFYLIAVAAQQIGVAATTVAMKISLVIPVLFSLMVLQNSLKDYAPLNYVGMALALVAVVLTSRRPTADTSGVEARESKKTWVLPLVVFVAAGLGDVIINYSNDRLLEPQQAGAFTMSTFLASAVIGVLVVVYQFLTKNIVVERKSLLAGIALGVPNYFSIYFLVKALFAFQNDGAFLYPVNNIGIILLGTLGGILFFGERLSKWNWMGFLLAIGALLLMSYQEVREMLF